MSNPDDLKSIFKDPSNIEIDNLSKPNQVETVLMITPVLWVSALHYSAGDQIRVGIGQWLQLVRCTNLLAAGPSISIINVREFRT